MMTTAEVAKQYRISPARIRQLARARGIEPTEIAPGRYAWSALAVKELKPGKAGRPKGKGVRP